MNVPHRARCAREETVGTVGRALGVAVATTLLVMASPGPSWARDDGELPGEKLSVIETLLLYVVAPGALFLLIALLVLAPSMGRGPRYRPGVGWWAAPIWFNGPESGDNLDAAVRTAVPTTDGGGASARW